MTKNNNIVWHKIEVDANAREKLLNQKGILFWFTGLSGSGKSTLANEFSKYLHAEGKLTFNLDGDNIRHGLCSDLGFSAADRKENIRRIGEVAKLFVNSGTIVLASFISPFSKDRNSIRKKIGDGKFIEVHVDCSLKECEKRDVKGLYKKARNNEIKDFSGISSPYEKPQNPEIIVNTSKKNIKENLEELISFYESKINISN